MPTFRPAINAGDGNFEKIVKYIPAEIVAAYTACIGVIAKTDCHMEKPIMPWIFYILLVFTPIYMYIAVIDNPSVSGDDKKKKQAIFHAIVSVLAYLAWTYALADEPLKCYFNGRIGFNPIAGSLILIGFTLKTRLLERMFLGKPETV